MSRVTSFTSSVIPLPAENVDTDQIVPARFLKVTDKAASATRSSATGGSRPTGPSRTHASCSTSPR